MSMDKEIRTAVKEKKALLGSRSVIRAVQNGKLKDLIYAKNTPVSTISDIKHYAEVSKVEVKQFTGNSVELGELCGKPFSVLLLGIAK